MTQMISTDAKGIIEMWDIDTYKAPARVIYKFKSDTDLYELAKNKTHAYCPAHCSSYLFLCSH